MCSLLLRGGGGEIASRWLETRDIAKMIDCSIKIAHIRAIRVLVSDLRDEQRSRWIEPPSVMETFDDDKPLA